MANRNPEPLPVYSSSAELQQTAVDKKTCLPVVLAITFLVILFVGFAVGK